MKGIFKKINFTFLEIILIEFVYTIIIIFKIIRKEKRFLALINRKLHLIIIKLKVLF